jgi:glycosyltransferase involved in cell wall biosynthesis
VWLKIIMSIWRNGGFVTTVARKLPIWLKTPLKRFVRLAYPTSKSVVGWTVATGMEFPTAGIVPGRETIVLIVHEATRTGAPILAWNLVRELQRKYNTVVLLRHGGPIRSAFEATAAAVICLPDHFQTIAAGVIASKIRTIYAPKYAIGNTVESRFIVAELEALSIPVVALVHEFSTTYRPVGMLYAFFSTASRIVFPAQIVADAAVADYKIFEGREYEILPQGSSKLPLGAGSGLNPPRLPESSQIGLGRSDVDFRVIGIGTITMRKGVEFFISVAAAAKKKLPALKLSFVWVGVHYDFDQPYFNLLKDQIERSDLGDTLVFAGELENLDPIYDHADILFLPSRLDPLPNVAIEAAIRGLPVVCFDQASGMAEILLEDEETQDLVVPYLDTGAASELICSLATDPIRAHKFSVAIAELARRRFNMEDYVHQVDGLGVRARRSLDQLKEGLKTIRQNEAFNSDLNLGYDAGSMSVERAILKYLHSSRLAAPWNKPRAGLFVRRPLEGFNPLIYASDNSEFDPHGLEDPLAHFARSGRPSGRWNHRIIKPAAKSASPVRPGKIAVHGHFHYPDLLPDFISRLNQNTNRFDLFLTTTSEKKASEIAAIISKFELSSVEISVGSNNGRDLAPFLRGLEDGLYSGYDVVGHFHGKKSPHVAGSIGVTWREFLWEHLVGGISAIADTILEAFAEDPRLGLVFPEDPHLNGWDENLKMAENLASRMKLSQPLPMYFDFPIGTMFWARPDALKPISGLNLPCDDFPAEPLPIDGTLLHALERLIPFAAADAGFSYATTYVRESKR